jgi:nucleoside 2-deoxyribosyltransferase
MAYKVFISHSTRDWGLVIALANLFSKLGIEPSVAEWYLTPGERLDEKVFTEIDQSDCTIVLLTKNGMRSNWVHQEIGYALKSNKPVIPLVEKGISSTDLSPLEGKEYIEYDPSQPEEAMMRLSTYTQLLKLKKEEREKTLLVAGAFIALLLLLSGEKR